MISKGSINSLHFDPKKWCVYEIKVIQTNIVEYVNWLTKINNYIEEGKNIPRRLLTTENKETTLESFFLDSNHRPVDHLQLFNALITQNENIKTYLQKEQTEEQQDYTSLRVLPFITQHIDTLVKEILTLAQTRTV